MTNALMNITVRVAGRAAQAEVAKLRAEIAALEGQLAKANAVAGAPNGIGGAASVSRLGKWGNRLQWTGRQIQTNFTLPILLATGAAVKFDLDNEKAFVHVQKVYGDTTSAVQYFVKQGMSPMEARQAVLNKKTGLFAQELDHLKKSFVAMSNYYGVAQKDVLDIAGAWAQAGASGADLAKGVQLSIEAMLIGDMSATKATDALISIQAQYGLSSAGLAQTLQYLNAVENQTAINMSGLIEGFQRTAGVARAAGVDTRHLAAMLAALVPAAGSAAQAGNALKTIITRLMSPTKEAAQVMNEMGLAVSSHAWQSMSAMDRLNLMAKKFGKGLSDSQKLVAATVLGSRYQVNKLVILMREMNSQTGMYSSALQATSSKQKAFNIYQKELQSILKSNPQQLKKLWVNIQNGMAQAVAPMIPYLLYLVAGIQHMVTAFSNLNPSMQKFVFFALLALAAIGPLGRYVGSLATLVSLLRPAFLFLGGAIAESASIALVWPFKFLMAGFGALASMIGTFVSLALTGLGKVIGYLFATGTAAAGPVAAGLASFAASGIAAIYEMIAVTTVAFYNWLTSLAAGSVLQGIAGLFASFWQGIVGIFVSGSSAAFAVQSAANAALFGDDVATQTARTAATTAGVSARVLEEAAGYLALGSVVAVGGAALVSAEEAYWLRRFAMAQIWLTYLSTLHATYNSIAFGLETAASTGRLAIEAATDTEILAIRAATTSELLVLDTAAATGSIGIFARMGRGIVGIFKSFGGIIVGTLRFLPALLARLFAGLADVILGPIGAAIAAVVVLIFIFRKQIVQVWNNIVNYFSDSSNGLTRAVIKAWNMLPQGIANALVAVVKIVRSAALAVYSWLSYLNPFAHHSPSLVENVTRGMDAVGKSFKTANKIAGPFKGAYSLVAKFSKEIAGLEAASRRYDQSQQRASIKKFSPGSVGTYNKLAATVNKLTPSMNKYKTAVDNQQRVVDSWTKKLNTANAALDVQQKKLDSLQAVADGYKDKIDAAQQSLSDYASAPLIGMRAMDDQIEANTQAQLKLQWQMMQMTKVTGTLDDVKTKLAAINGAQELLNGQKSDLRAAGAGSEILSAYDDQIKALDGTKTAYSQNMSALSDLQNQLDALSAQADELDLTKRLKFDDLTYQIQKAADTTKELSFDDIMAGIKSAQGDIATYTDKWNAANEAVARQQAIVDKATASRDKMQASLDREQASLDAVTEKYNNVNNAISAMQAAMDAAAAAAQNLQSKQNAIKEAKKAKKTAHKKAGSGSEGMISPGLQNFRDAAGGNFPQVGGGGKEIRTNFDPKKSLPAIDKITKDLNDQVANAIAGLNPFSWIKAKWKDFASWFSGVWNTLASGFGDFFKHMFDGISAPGGLSKISGLFDGIKNTIGNVSKWVEDILDKLGKWIGGWAGKLWNLFGPDITKIVDGIKKGFSSIVDKVKPELDKFKPVLKQFADSFGNMVDTVKSVFGSIVGAVKNVIKVLAPILDPMIEGLKAALSIVIVVFGGIAKVILSTIAHMIKPAFDMIGTVLAAVIQVVRGLLKILVGIFSLNFSMIISGVMDIFGGLAKGVWGLVTGMVNIVEAAIGGFVAGIVGFFKWLWDVLLGHSIIPDIINGIIAAFQILVAVPVWLWTNIIQPIANAFISLWSDFVQPALSAWWDGIQKVWSGLTTAATWVWNNVLKPVFDKIKELWDKWVQPAFAAWWAGVQATWSALKNAPTWLWNNVLKPVLDKVKELWDKWVKPALGAWWGGVQAEWAALKAAGKWIWDNVLNPVLGKVKDLWDNVKTSLGTWWNGIQTAWSSLKGLGGWIKNNVMDPVLQKVKDGWNAVKDWLSGSKDMLLKPAHAIVNAVVNAVNWLIKGLNAISGALPGISFHVNLIPQMAEGGAVPKRRVGSGFKTNGARAIVGEGKANYPEYVIPTDPTHRRRASALLASAAGRLGMVASGVNNRGAYGDSAADMLKTLKNNPTASAGAIPEFGLGGILGNLNPVNLVKGAASWMKGNLHKLASQIFNPIADAGEDIIRNHSSWIPKQEGLYGIEKARDWVNQTDDAAYELAQKVKEAMVPKGIEGAIKWAKTQVGKPYIWGGVGPAGYDCSGFQSAITNVIHGKNPHSRVGTTAGFPWGGFAGGFSPKGYTIGSTKSYAGGVGHMAGTLNGVNVESSGGVGVRVGGGARGWNDGGFNTHAHLTGLKYGGIVKRRMGGTTVRVGEGTRDEAVIPLPKNWKTNSSSSTTETTELHFHGDLSFPNIKSGEDAEVLISNLKSLAGGV